MMRLPGFELDSQLGKLESSELDYSRTCCFCWVSEISSSVNGDNVEVDLSALNLQFAG